VSAAPPSVAGPPYGRRLLVLAGVALAYFATARLGLLVALPPSKKATPVWLASGIAWAALLHLGRWTWPAVALGAFAANLADAFAPGETRLVAVHLAVSAAIALGSTLQSVLGASALRRHLPGGPLQDAGGVARFMGVTLSACLVAPTVGTLALGLSGFAPWSAAPASWAAWWIGDLMGVVLVVPLVCAWLRPPSAPVRSGSRAEAVLLVLAVGAVGVLLYEGSLLPPQVSEVAVSFAVPLLLWTAFRFGPRWATALLLVVATTAAVGAALGHGVVRGPTVPESLLALQLYLAVVAVTTLLLCGVLAERHRARDALERLNRSLEDQVASRTADLAGALREKEALLGEVHHRVKNNLQVVSSLLSLQSGYAKDPRVAAMFRESQARVAAIALVHERLYRSPDLARVDFGGYVGALADSLVASYRLPSRHVSLVKRLDDVPVPIQRAIPCGLVIGELVTNSLRHAFPDGRSGEILVEVRTADDGGIRIAVADDGVGLPPGFDPKDSPSLGWRIVTTLASQVGATLAVSSDRGTRVELEVPALATRGSVA
jgi:two-component sensor histidine kinase/integral membrane sensor domain MASE1